MSGEDAPRPCLENLIVLTNKTEVRHEIGVRSRVFGHTLDHRIGLMRIYSFMLIIRKSRY